MRKKLFQRSVALGLMAIVFYSFVAFTTPGEKYFEIAKNLDIFATLYKEVNSYYVDDINPNKLMKIGIDAMLESLDPYTNYIPEDDIEDYRTMTTGQYGGIGALIGKSNGKNIIIMPYEGFPAYNSGLKIGDELIEVDGIKVTEKSTSEISKLLKGQANTDMTLTIRRYGEEDLLNIALKREKITINNVPYYGMVNPKVGYIKLQDFTTGAGKEVKNALEELKSQGAQKIIFDLRDNPGGLLSEAVNVSNVFVPKGSEIVHTKGKVKDWNKSYKALNSPSDTNIPLVVLTSSRSASAAEIVAGVIQDYDRGVLVGSKTFGKGLVQATRPLTYNSQLKITTAKYYIPSGRCIQSIDYRSRNEDGSVGRVPDSLKTAFETNNGRIVYDGGGIDPDLEVEKETFAPITISLVAKGLIFDYATIYYYKHPEIAEAKEFKVSQADFEEFITWLKDKDYDYTTKVEKTVDELVEYAKTEKYYNDIDEQINSLKKRISHNKEQDLVKFQSEIKSLLEEEIASRYYLRDGKVEASFDNDPYIQQALNVLENQNEYQSILVRK
ncbi:MAG: S41 family peptidase [Candidatus Cyclobacteriaceae bacterium M3_2C_046]